MKVEQDVVFMIYITTDTAEEYDLIYDELEDYVHDGSFVSAGSWRITIHCDTNEQRDSVLAQLEKLKERM